MIQLQFYLGSINSLVIVLFFILNLFMLLNSLQNSSRNKILQNKFVDNILCIESSQANLKDENTHDDNQQYKDIADKILQYFKTETSYLEFNFTLTQLTHSIGCSNSGVVSNAIKNCLNTSFYELLANYRILYATRLIGDNLEKTLESISEECGFRSQSTFNKYFKKFTNFKPSDYRVSIKKQTLLN